MSKIHPKLTLSEAHYYSRLKTSEYDFLEVVLDEAGRMKIKFLDERWREKKELVKVLEEIIGLIKDLDK